MVEIHNWSEQSALMHVITGDEYVTGSGDEEGEDIIVDGVSRL
jgi:hypothetical protein